MEDRSRTRFFRRASGLAQGNGTYARYLRFLLEVCGTTMTPEPSDHLRIVAVIQARMEPENLPGTALNPIAGKPPLQQIVHCLKRSQFIEQIAIATSTNPCDDPVAEFGRKNGTVVVRGPQGDVLARFARAAELLDADIIVHVLADAPSVDEGFIDYLVVLLIGQNGDYVDLDRHAAGHEGVDVFSRRALDKLMMDARDDAVAREHVAGYFKLHPGFVRIVHAPAYPQPAQVPGGLAADTHGDLAYVKALHERIAAIAGQPLPADRPLPIGYEPLLRQKKANVRQKAPDKSGAIALIRCDGGGRFGYGHVKRMVALARALRDREGIGALFAVNGTDDALAPIRRAGFEARHIDVDDGAAALNAMVAERAPDILVCDLCEGLDPSELESLSSRVCLTAVIDDSSTRRLAADLAYYPPLPQVRMLDWSGSYCKRRIGWEWAILGLGKPAAQWRRSGLRPTLLVTMGGSDPMALTLKAARAIAKLDPAFRARFVIGPGVSDRAQLARAIVALAPNFETVEGADGLATEFAACDVALAAFGVTAYELAAYGVPALYLCLSEDHALCASAFEALGMGRSLGIVANASDSTIANAVHALMNDASRRRDMRAAGLATIDGEGAARVAADLAACLAQRRLAIPLRSAR